MRSSGCGCGGRCAICSSGSCRSCVVCCGNCPWWMSGLGGVRSGDEVYLLSCLSWWRCGSICVVCPCGRCGVGVSLRSCSRFRDICL